MGENQRVEIHQTECERLTEIVHLVNTTEYCTIKTNAVHKKFGYANAEFDAEFYLQFIKPGIIAKYTLW